MAFITRFGHIAGFLLDQLQAGLSEFMFPSLCARCGVRLEQGAAAFCTLCRFHSFPASDRPPDLLPEGVEFMQAMWAYDKGGALQKAVHALKYGSRPDIGVELGRTLAVLMLPELLARHALAIEACCLIPVPLHPARRRRRGYNQAERIAAGINEVTGMDVMPEGWIRRRRHTRSQTGLDEERRHRNVDALFQLGDPERFTAWVSGRMPILVDDVITTGATVHSLHASIRAWVPRIGAVFVASG